MDVTEILPKFLWLGDYKSAHNTGFLKRNKIKLVINVTPDIANTGANHIGIDVIRIPILNEEDYIEYLKPMLPKICIHLKKLMINKKGGVLIHCKRGHRRSATIVVAFLMFLGMPLCKAVNKIKKIRPGSFKCGSIIIRSLLGEMNIPECITGIANKCNTNLLK